MIGVGTAPFWLPWGQVWLQEFPLVVCQISSCHATSVPESWFCKHALAKKQVEAGGEAEGSDQEHSRPGDEVDAAFWYRADPTLLAPSAVQQGVGAK